MFRNTIGVLSVGLALTQPLYLAYAGGDTPISSPSDCVTLGEGEDPQCYFQSAYEDLFQVPKILLGTPGSNTINDLIGKQVAVLVSDHEPMIIEGILKEVERKSWMNYAGESNPYVLYHIQISNGSVVTADSDKIIGLRAAISRISPEQFSNRYRTWKKIESYLAQSDYSDAISHQYTIELVGQTAAFLVKNSFSFTSVVEGTILSKQNLVSSDYTGETEKFTRYRIKTAGANEKVVEVDSDRIVDWRIKPFPLTMKVLK